MAGTMERLFPKGSQDYSNIGQNQTSGEIPVALSVSIANTKENTVEIRVHALTIAGTGGTPGFQFIVRATAPTNEEPNSVFDDSTALVTVSATSTSGVPYLLRGTIPANSGGWISVYIKAVQGTAGAGTLKGTFSGDISRKE